MYPCLCSAAMGFAPVRFTQRGKGRLSEDRRRLEVSYSSFSVRSSRVPRFVEFSILKTEICPHRRCARLFKAREEGGRKVRHSDVRWRAHVQVRVEGPARVIRHQNLHLTFWQILDVLIERACFRSLDVDRSACLLISLESKELPSLHGQMAPRDAMFR